MSILVTGARGQLGTELCHLLDEQGKTYLAIGLEELDITDKQQVERYFQKHQPTIVYHCAAYTAVDKAEDEGKELNEVVNVAGTRNVAEAAEAISAILVYISTDYVFDGSQKDHQYQVNDKTHPLNEYGRAKLAGEQAVQEVMTRYYIIRTSWVFGQYGPNFVFTMQRLAKSNPVLTIVDDQFGRPTWTRDLAEFMTYAIDKQIDYGVYHFSNDNSCSWFDFAKEILKNEEVEVKAVSSEEFPQKATRPKYSVLDLSKVKNTGFVIESWKEALADLLKLIN